jgi:phosphate starvation-inducible PhoH-like protein
MATTKRKPKNSLKSDPLFANFRPIEGMTDSQDDMIDSFRQGYNVVAVGSAGTGKTYVGLALALEALIEGRVNKIILIRSAKSSSAISDCGVTGDSRSPTCSAAHTS